MSAVASVKSEPNVTDSDSERLSEFSKLVTADRSKIEAERARDGYSIHKNLNRIWTPGFRKPIIARRYFSQTIQQPFVYGAPLFPGQEKAVEALFGGMAYHVDREVVLSWGGRLSEIGEQNLGGVSATVLLQEKPDTDVGVQTIITGPRGDPALFQAALIEATLKPGAVSLVKTEPDTRGFQSVTAEFIVPENISWDGLEHRVLAKFTVKLPRAGQGNAAGFFMELFRLTNGRPAQHYQDSAAAVIALDEIIFANPQSVSIIVDDGTEMRREIQPDRFFGKKIAMLLTQTAGGLFEKAFLQSFNGEAPEVIQRGVDGRAVRPEWRSWNENGIKRISELSYPEAPYRVRYEENAVATSSGVVAHELSVMRLLSTDTDPELMKISFNTGNGRGLRDLGIKSPTEQRGRFKISVNGKDGYGFGEVCVSPTQQRSGLNGDDPVYYTRVTLTPRHPHDLKTKKIILHVVHRKDGVYTETQIVPLSIVKAPAFKLQ